LENVQLDIVLWGPSVNDEFQIVERDFYTSLIGSASQGLPPFLAEYNTTTPAQTIGVGSYHVGFTIIPSNTGVALGTQDLQNELVAQINAAHLPAPLNSNVVYMVHLPPGIQVSTDLGTT
jgi:hypothetical protein